MTAARFDPGPYPRTYRTPIVLRVALGVILLPFLLGLATLSLEPGTGPSHSWLDTFIALAGAAAMTWLWLVLLVTRVVLEPAAIEIRRLGGTRRVDRSAILGCNVSGTQRGRATVLLNVEGEPRRVGTSVPLATDAAFKAWFTGLADAAMEEVFAHQRLAAADPRLGPTPAERVAHGTRVRTTTRRLTLVAIALGAWMAYADRLPAWTLPLLAALPLLAFALCRRWPELFSLSAPRASLRGDLGGLLVVPAVVLAVHGWRDLTLLEPLQLLVPTLVAGGLLAAVALASCADLRERPVVALLIAGCCLVIAAGALALANAWYDPSTPVRERVAVTARLKSGGRSPTRSLRLATQPAGLPSRVVRVRDAVWFDSAAGADVCVVQQDGLFHWRWFDVTAACPP